MSTSAFNDKGEFALVMGSVKGVRKFRLDDNGALISSTNAYVWQPGWNEARHISTDYANVAEWVTRQRLDEHAIPLNKLTNLSKQQRDILVKHSNPQTVIPLVWVPETRSVMALVIRGALATYLEIRESGVAVERKAPGELEARLLGKFSADQIGAALAELTKPCGDFGSCGSCGFYSYFNPESSSYDGAVHGIMEGAGKTWHGPQGFRSSRARIVAAWISPDARRSEAWVKAQLRYPDVKGYEDEQEMWAAHLPRTG